MSVITFTGSISGNTLTVSTVPVGGTLAVNNTIQAPGVLPNVRILSFGTGTGSTGTYFLTKELTIALASTTITANSEETLVTSYQNLEGSAIVSFYQVDLTTLGGGIFYFTNEKNQLLVNPTWQGQVYTAIPIEVNGFELNGNQFPRPTLKLSNFAAVMSGLAKQYADLVNVKFTRKRTRLKYLDAVNFPSGVNISADPNTYYTDDIYYVNRKIGENRLYVEWELTSALDISGIKLPRRQIIQNTCMWKYRSAECSYAGTNYFDTNDDVTTQANDVCGKRLSSCRKRFPGSTTVLPYGGFPGASLTL